MTKLPKERTGNTVKSKYEDILVLFLKESEFPNNKDKSVFAN